MFGDGLAILSRSLGARGGLADRRTLERVFTVTCLAAAPIAASWSLGKPVVLLQIAGAVEAAHIPVVAGLTLYINRHVLVPDLRPGRFAVGMTSTAALFFAAFAVLYPLQLAGLLDA
jgi:hypothetical protein